MPTLKECHLKFGRASEQIPYPPGFSGAKSGRIEDEEFFIGKEPCYLTSDEVKVAEAYCAELTKRAYKQEVVLTGAVLTDPDDYLFGKTHEELDAIEYDMNLPNSRPPEGGENSIRERVYRIREALPDHPLDHRALTAAP